MSLTVHSPAAMPFVIVEAPTYGELVKFTLSSKSLKFGNPRRIPGGGGFRAFAPIPKEQNETRN